TVSQLDLSRMRKGVLETVVVHNHGRIFKFTGDGALIESKAVGVQAVIDNADRFIDFRVGHAELSGDQLHQNSVERLMLAADLSYQMGWLAMLILGVLTQVAVAVVQLERLRPQALALFVFTTAFAATVVLVGLAEQPLFGKDIDAEPLRSAAASARP